MGLSPRTKFNVTDVSNGGAIKVTGNQKQDTWLSIFYCFMALERGAAMRKEIIKASLPTILL